MKKIIAIILTLIVALSFASCKKTTPADTDTSDSMSVQTDGATDNTAVSDGVKPAEILEGNFKKAVENGSDKTAEELAAAVIDDERIPYACMTMPVEEGYLNGFSEEITGFEEGANFGPVIGTIPFVGYVFKLSADADVDSFMNTLKEKSDLNWNICTSADEKVCTSEGTTVFFTMCPASFNQ